MAKDEMAEQAGHVLAHGTARTRAAKGESDKGGKDGGSGKAKGKKKIRKIEIEPAHDGTHVIKHMHQPPHDMPKDDETYTAPDMDALKQHLEEHLGGGAGESEEGAEQGGGEEEMAAAQGGGAGMAAGGAAQA